jgi:phage terminase large subunit-like protein
VAKAVEEYESAIHSRADDPRTSIRTMIMQRIKPNDLSARWIEILSNLTHVRLPTEYESPERAECTCGTCTKRNVFGFLDWRTREGERLHARFTDAFVAEARRVLASKFDGQHQQRPAAAGGLIFKVGNWSWYSLTSTFAAARPPGARLDPPYLLTRRLKDPTSLEVDYVDLSIDATGGSSDESASALGITAWAGKAERRFMLRDFTPGPATWLQTMRHVVDALRATVKIAGKQRLYTVLIEKKALGAALIGQLEQAVHDGEIRYPDGSPVKVRVEAYEPQGSKEDRADAAEPDQAAGLIYLLDGDPGNTGPWRDEVEGFPRAQRDDRTDSMSQELDYRRVTATGWVELFKKKRAEERERRSATPG